MLFPSQPYLPSSKCKSFQKQGLYFTLGSRFWAFSKHNFSARKKKPNLDKACSFGINFYVWLAIIDSLFLGENWTKPAGPLLAQPVTMDLSKKLDPKQKTIQTFNIDTQSFKRFLTFWDKY